MRHTHPFRDFPVCTRERRLCFKTSPEKPAEKPKEITSKDLEEQKEVKEAANNLAKKIDDLSKTPPQKQEQEQKDIVGQLEKFRNTFSEEQLKTILSALNTRKEVLLKELQDMTKKIKEETAERTAQLRKDVGPYIDRISSTAKEAVVKSGIPEWVNATLDYVGDNAVTRFIRKSYHTLMANADRILPEKLKQWLPFLKDQIDGSKIMLTKIGARDGIADAAKEMNFAVDWTKFGVFWETYLQKRYELALKDNPNLTSRDFAKREMMQLLQGKTSTAATLIVDLGDYVEPKPSPSIAAAPDAKPPDAPKPALDTFGLSNAWKANTPAPIPDSGLTFKMETGGDFATLKRNEIKVGDIRFTVNIMPTDARILFKPILSSDGKSLKESLLVIEHPSGEATRGHAEFTLHALKYLPNVYSNTFDDLTVRFTKTTS